MTSTAKTVLFWIMTFLTVVLLYSAAQHGSSASAKHTHLMRLGHAELLMILFVAVIVFSPSLTDRQRFNALKTGLNRTFNKTFFVMLTVILAIFRFAELWLH
jgi:hypothetical protein